MGDYQNMLTRNTQGVDPNWRANQKAAGVAANPNVGAVGTGQWGTPLSTPQGGGLLGYTVNGQFPAGLSNYGQDGSIPGAEPAYGVKSFTVTPELRSPSQYKDYLQTDAYEILKSNAEREANRQSAFSRFVSSPIGMGTLGAIGAGFGASALGGAFSGGGMTGVSAGGSTLGAGGLTSEALLAAPASSFAAPSTLGTFAKGAALKGALGSGIASLAGGGDTSDILKSAALGGLTGGYAPGLAGSIGLTGRGASAFSSALGGASKGYAAGGDLKSALMGAGIGGIGDYFMSGFRPHGSGYSSEDLLSSPTGSPKGFSASGGLGVEPSKLSEGLGMLKDYASPLGSALSGYNQYKTSEDAEDEMLRANRQALGALNPYSRAGLQANRDLQAKMASGELGSPFSMDMFEVDPGYQFALEQGEQALARKQSAAGNRFGGAALKAAQEYGQDLANQTYNDAYTRYGIDQNRLYDMLSGQQNIGLNAAYGQADLHNIAGDIRGNALTNRSNILTATLADLLRGSNDWF